MSTAPLLVEDAPDQHGHLHQDYHQERPRKRSKYRRGRLYRRHGTSEDGQSNATTTEHVHGLQHRVLHRVGGHLGVLCDASCGGQERNSADLRRLDSGLVVSHDRPLCISAPEAATLRKMRVWERRLARRRRSSDGVRRDSCSSKGAVLPPAGRISSAKALRICGDCRCALRLPGAWQAARRQWAPDRRRGCDAHSPYTLTHWNSRTSRVGALRSSAVTRLGRFAGPHDPHRRKHPEVSGGYLHVLPAQIFQRLGVLASGSKV
jgi:hypothetical protein